MAREWVCLVLAAELLLHEAQQVRPSIRGGRRQIGLGEIGQPVVPSQSERLVLRSEIAGPGVADRPDADEARQIGVGIALEFRHHRADLGVRDALGHFVASMHVVDAVGMVRRLRLHAADDSEFVDLLGHARQILADLGSRDARLDGAERPARWPARLHVEGVELAGPAVHPQEDAAFPAFLRLGGARLRAEQAAEVRRRQSRPGDQASLEERPPAEVLGQRTAWLHERFSSNHARSGALFPLPAGKEERKNQ